MLLFCQSAIAQAQIENIRVDNPGSDNPEEVSISINPVAPNYIAAGANINHFFGSADMGATWTSSRMTSQYGVWGDPCLVYDAEGNLYYTHLSYPPESTGYWLDRIVVQRSADNGMTWTDGTGVGHISPKEQDKPWMAVDMTSDEYKNSLYLAWTEFDQYESSDPSDSTRILFSKSVDFGETWSDPVRVSDQGGNALDGDLTVEGAVPSVGPDGQVYLSWAGPLGIMFDKSTDGGQTFGKDIFVTDQPGGWDFNVSGIYRGNGLPVTICDTSHSAYRGNIYILWSDQRNGLDNTDVFITKSADEGETWSVPLRVNDDNSGRHQFFPWITIDQTTGILYVVFYDRRNTTGDATDVYLAKSEDGGDSFQNFRISESPFTPNASKFFGDYINIAVYDRHVYPIWMRLDDTVLSIWTALYYDSAAVGISDDMTDRIPAAFNLEQNYPNPFNPVTTIRYGLPESELVNVTIYDLSGRQVVKLLNRKQQAGWHHIEWDGTDGHGTSVSTGMYFYRLRAGDFSQVKKMTLLR